MDEIKKDYKNSALWSFIIGIVCDSILLTIFFISARMEELSGSLLSSNSLLIVFLPLAYGLFLGIKGANSSRKVLSWIGALLCGLTVGPALIFFVIFAGFAILRLFFPVVITGF